jgi:hypothetical protein
VTPITGGIHAEVGMRPAQKKNGGAADQEHSHRAFFSKDEKLVENTP